MFHSKKNSIAEQFSGLSMKDLVGAPLSAAYEASRNLMETGAVFTQKLPDTEKDDKK